MKENKILIGGKAMNYYGSSRLTKDANYLINNTTTNEPFLHDKDNEVGFINANGNKFFATIYKKEAKNQIATPQALLELKAYSFIQHCLNANWQKVNDTEFDMKFLVLKFNLTDVPLVKKFLSAGEYLEVMKVINSAKR